MTKHKDETGTEFPVDPVELAAHYIYDWATGHISQAVLGELLGEIKVGDKTFAEHSGERKKAAYKEQHGKDFAG